MSRYAQIASRAFNTPLLVEPAKAQAFLVGLGARVLGGQIVLSSAAIDHPQAPRASGAAPRASILEDGVGRRRRERGAQLYPVVDGVAVIDVTGTMVHRGSWIGESSGVTSYEGINAQLNAVEDDPSARGVALELDTFGGEVAGCFDTGDRIRSIRAKKPVWAFVSESAYSAGYALASQADRIILPRTGGVGSIGVLSMHVDYSQQLEDEGIVVTMIHSGAHKVDGNPYETLPELVRAEWQSRADQLRQLFAETVAAGRGDRFNAAAALATEARCFMGQEAVAAGLADEVSDLRTSFAAFREKVNGRGLHAISFGTVAGAAYKEKVMTEKPKTTAENPAQTPAEDPATTTAPAPEQPAAAPAGENASAVRAAAADLAEVAAQASKLGVTVDLADAIRTGMSAETLRASVLAKLASASDAAPVSTAHPPQAKVESPIVKAAQAAAARAAK